MAVLLKRRGEERGIVEAGEVFERSEFHRLAVLGFCELFGDEQADHSDSLAGVQVHQNGRRGPHLAEDGCVVRVC